MFDLSNEYDVWKSCSSKQRFDTYRKAKKYACRYGLAFYYCPVCGGYHLTSDLSERDNKHYPNKVKKKIGRNK